MLCHTLLKSKQSPLPQNKEGQSSGYPIGKQPGEGQVKLEASREPIGQPGQVPLEQARTSPTQLPCSEPQHSSAPLGQSLAIKQAAPE